MAPAVCLPTDAPKPSSSPQDSASDKQTSSSSSQPNSNENKLSLASLAAVTRYPGVPSLLLMQGGANFAGALMHSTFALVLQQRFQLSSKENGLVLSWVGVCIATGK